jgi:hypothetical protein
MYSFHAKFFRSTLRLIRRMPAEHARSAIARSSARPVLPAAEDADEGDVDGADEGVLKSPASGVLAGLLVGLVSLWSAW